ncbi:hypothetical protein IWQ60_004928 [Tieghemiomyces parasiticus]|uniref:RWD domain-containing protein n=1 Tax=Tieghemiomyces parasiticus TaxID=78921 RepID=A0A9W8DV25_9FUNG|nr:hypothetical protein IWQ60_004928 [Tieghemiomyces parasiticus]
MPTSPARPIGLPSVTTRQSAVEAYTQDPEAQCDDDPTLKNFRFTLRFRADNVPDEGGSVRWQLVEVYLPPSYPDAPPEVHLRGLSKPGYPGVLVAEGAVSQLTEYLQRLKALKWQAFVIRHDEPSWPTTADQTKATRGRLADVLCTPGVTERESISEVAAVEEQAVASAFLQTSQYVSARVDTEI